MKKAELLLPTLTSLMARGRLIQSDFDLHDVRYVLTQLGVNQRGWRMLLNFGEPLFGALRGTSMHDRRPLAAVENLAAFLTLLQQCEMDIPPPPELIRAWVMMPFPSHGAIQLGDVPVGLFRAAWIEAVRLQYSGQGLDAFLADELPAVVTWFFVTGQHEWLTVQELKNGWSWFRNHQLGWRRRCRHSHDMQQDWQPYFKASWVEDGVKVVELVSAAAITEEGETMRHCVANCIDACRAGEYLVFSLRQPATDERLATLGLYFNRYEWSIEDFRIEYNGEPDPPLWDVAYAVIERCAAMLEPPRAYEPKQRVLCLL